MSEREYTAAFWSAVNAAFNDNDRARRFFTDMPAFVALTTAAAESGYAKGQPVEAAAREWFNVSVMHVLARRGRGHQPHNRDLPGQRNLFAT
jgi:hypothetical protein